MSSKTLESDAAAIPVSDDRPDHYQMVEATNQQISPVRNYLNSDMKHMFGK